MKIALISPHRPDVPFALGLAVGSWLMQGHNVEVIQCFTRSEHAPYSDASSLHPNDRMSFVSATVKREAESWVKQYRDPIYTGRLTLIDLNLKDAPLRLHIAPDEVFGLSVNATDKSIEKTRKALARSHAAAFVLPLGLDRHIDHLTTRAAALPEDPSATPLAFYEDALPHLHADLKVTVDDEVRQLAVLTRGSLQPWFASTTITGDGSHQAGLLQAAVARKRRLALCFDSQIDNKTTDTIAQSCLRYGGQERLWSNAAWQSLFADH